MLLFFEGFQPQNVLILFLAFLPVHLRKLLLTLVIMSNWECLRYIIFQYYS